MLTVRKHPAPEGALRLLAWLRGCPGGYSQKAPSTRRCIKTRLLVREGANSGRQKAPSTRRCIKTCFAAPQPPGDRVVRKHPAPEGALRHRVRHLGVHVVSPSESTQHQKVHQDPDRSIAMGSHSRQKAPSTRRCIKTVAGAASSLSTTQAESTQHQKVH